MTIESEKCDLWQLDSDESWWICHRRI